jgi:hypothetical protein
MTLFKKAVKGGWHMQKMIAPVIAGALLAATISAQTTTPTTSTTTTSTFCKTVKGMSTETIMPASQAPNDPFGRVIGLFSGDFAGVATVSLTSFLTSAPMFSPTSGPSTLMQVRHVFLTGPGDTISTLGQVLFNPAPATQPTQTNFVNSICPLAPCIVENPQVLTVIGGTGRWAGATGQITTLGLGNLNLPANEGSFVYMVSGQVCIPEP